MEIKNRKRLLYNSWKNKAKAIAKDVKEKYKIVALRLAGAKDSSKLILR